MVYFPFSQNELSKEFNEKAQTIVGAACSLAGYYQEYARALFTGLPLPNLPKLPEKQTMLIGELLDNDREHYFRTPETEDGFATAKLFYATQIDFYLKNPNLIAVFGPGADLLPTMMLRAREFFPETFAEIDHYFDRAVDDLLEFYEQNNNPPPPEPWR